MKLHDLQEVGSGREGTLSLSYFEIVDKVFEPNVTELDDPDKVKASWGFIDDIGRKGFIWSYKFEGNIEECNSFSVSGNKELLKELFKDNIKI
mgnify:CR=1 FL=1